MSKNIITKHPSFTAVLHAAVKNAESGLDAKTIADLVGKPYQTLMSELSRQEGHKLGADLVLPLIEASASLMPVHFLARQLGGAFVLLPEAASHNGELVETLASSVKEFGEFAAETAVNISDGNIPADQLARINKEADEAIEAILAMKKLARLTHAKQYGSLGQAGENKECL